MARHSSRTNVTPALRAFYRHLATRHYQINRGRVLQGPARHVRTDWNAPVATIAL
ncbi:hypothetical protein SEA_BANTAM_169 [Gordonia phage Bantam]|uniref:Uncharacterized protein n=1 Tax=Gordonia phage Bantam TaxID=1887641 RepID=A0A1B3AYL2_9CAUD|nr:hypothetical protein BIZ77_gp010 [Gordonia phage Bantam]AOE43858.1 hypothetical protein SEA_BANTAM_169 [Gordonia phage Bantam]